MVSPFAAFPPSVAPPFPVAFSTCGEWIKYHPWTKRDWHKIMKYIFFFHTAVFNFKNQDGNDRAVKVELSKGLFSSFFLSFCSLFSSSLSCCNLRRQRNTSHLKLISWCILSQTLRTKIYVEARTCWNGVLPLYNWSSFSASDATLLPQGICWRLDLFSSSSRSLCSFCSFFSFFSFLSFLLFFSSKRGSGRTESRAVKKAQVLPRSSPFCLFCLSFSLPWQQWGTTSSHMVGIIMFKLHEDPVFSWSYSSGPCFDNTRTNSWTRKNWKCSPYLGVILKVEHFSAVK